MPSGCILHILIYSFYAFRGIMNEDYIISATSRLIRRSMWDKFSERHKTLSILNPKYIGRL